VAVAVEFQSAEPVATVLLQQRPLFCAELYSEGANWAAISESIVFEYGRRLPLRAVTDAWMAGKALVGFG
jgi:hypothetical protein